MIEQQYYNQYIQSSTQKTDKLLAPSKVVNPMTKRTTYEMSKEDI